MRNQGVMVSTQLLIVKASQLSAFFPRKSARANELSVRRLLRANCIVARCVTHTCQRPPNEVREEALDFINQMREKVIGGNRDNRCVINVDQIPVFFNMPSGRTLNRSGTFGVVLCVDERAH